MALPKGYLGHAHNIIRGTKIGLSTQNKNNEFPGKSWPDRWACAWYTAPKKIRKTQNKQD